MVMGTGLFQPESNVWHSHNDMVAEQNGWSIKFTRDNKDPTSSTFMVEVDEVA